MVDARSKLNDTLAPIYKQGANLLSRCLWSHIPSEVSS